ncbi:MAG: hypothetical protein K6E29_06860 [Cyanobacteria bacterium RUI128]|nr:hypothetical protein [Cyanobacteria bacterium RUI128]
MSIVSAGSEILSHNIKGSSTRFATEAGKVARSLNRIAQRSGKADRMAYTFPKATPEDLLRLTSKKIEDSYKRVTWTNPNDNKVYHILEEGRKGGKIQVRILNSEGEFVKNAELEPKNIVIFDNFFSPRGVTHGEMMETFIRRFNPFANVERLEHKKGLIENLRYRGKLPIGLELKRFQTLESQVEKGKKVDYISMSETHLVDIEDVVKEKGSVQQKYVAQSPYIREIEPIFKRLMSSGTRIIEAAGNEANFAKEVVSDRLAIEGVEGVGSLKGRRIAQDSCSRNSVFTQHYEQRNYSAQLVTDENGKALGVNLTGQSGVDLPLNWKTKKLVGRKFGGTSYAVPVRVAKLALNDMMQGII